MVVSSGKGEHRRSARVGSAASPSRAPDGLTRASFRCGSVADSGGGVDAPGDAHDVAPLGEVDGDERGDPVPGALARTCA